MEKIKRRPWTIEEKQSALKSCANKCACCGTKLTFKTLTMEHVVPISKGGENKLDNLVALCESCNSHKGNKFYWPLGFYMALNHKGKLSSIDNYTHKWVDKNINAEHFAEFPMISESISFMIKPKNFAYNFKNGAYIPSLIMDVSEIGPTELRELGISQNKMRKSIQYPDKLFSLVAATKRSDGKCLGVFSLQVNEGTIFISEVWTSTPKINHMVAIGLINALCEQWYKLGVDVIIFRTTDSKSIEEMTTRMINIPMKHCKNSYNDFDYPGKDATIYGSNQLLIKTFSKEEANMHTAIDSASDFMRKLSDNLH